ncbi:polymeric immunoglobulin receptor isoform X1 [Scomber japonicus]|uniref:polymeric immunoglobulin receptor isoform X1 n=1 Tax=Scomber japonicus TaxID=13676 RepID=UPI002305689E|nr:polymeric immunoglobulin receptor isoform X1 [Scomber japonicus]
MPQLLILTLSLLPWIPASLCGGVNTVEEHAVLEGKPLAIPCHYEPQYTSYVKYWCRGRMREFCSSLARSDDPSSPNSAEKKVSIYDDPVQLVFTVTMKDLKVEDSGWYMCGVEIGGVWSADVVAYTNIKVVHGLSVVNSRLSAEEGGSVTVECLYSERYRESSKKWCRSGDWSSCLTTGSDGSYEDTSVAINDDRTGSLTITFKKLQMRDTGWYWCSAGQQQISVHVLVTPPASTTAVSVMSSSTSSQSIAYVPPPKPITKESWNSHSHILESLLVCASFMLLVGLAIFARKMWKLHNPYCQIPERLPGQRQMEGVKTRLSEYSGDVGDLQNAAVVFLNKNPQSAHMC